MKNKRLLYFAIVTTLLIISYVGYKYHKARILEDAQLALAKGYPAVSASLIDGRISDYAQTKEGCVTLINIYITIKDLESLNESAQWCMLNGFEIEEVIIGLAKFQDGNSAEESAKNILEQGLFKFPNSKIITFSLARLCLKLRQLDCSKKYYNKLARIDINDGNLLLESLTFFVENKFFKDALPIALRLKGTNLNDPVSKLYMARVFAKNDLKSELIVMKSEAEQILSTLPADKVISIKNKFNDIFNPPTFIEPTPVGPNMAHPNLNLPPKRQK